MKTTRAATRTVMCYCLHMKSKKSLKLKILLPVAALVLLAGGGILAYNLAPKQAAADTPAPKSTFEFDASKAPGWFAGKNIDGEEINADAAPTSKKLASTTRIIAQGTAEKPTGNCFVQYSYWANSTKDVNQTLSELSAPSNTSTPGSFVLEPAGVTSQKINSNNGTLSYDLHRYNITGSDTEKMSTGQEIAVFKAGTGYVDIRGYCKTVDELEVTLPVFSAVSFKQG